MSCSYQLARNLAVTGINSCMSLSADLNKAHSHMKDVIKQLWSFKCSKDPKFVALMKDLEGQVLEALSKDEWYNRWGRHYLPSLGRAHQLQFCNNFKDPGVQVYGEAGNFKKVRDYCDDVFLKLPLPTPSRPISKAPKVDPVTNVAIHRPVAASAYYDSGCVCFSPDSLVLMDDLTLKRCDEVKKGDKIFGGAIVRCVVKTLCEEVSLVRINEQLKITPWHPIKMEGKWTFPIKIQKSEMYRCGSVYNFLLDKRDTAMILGGVECCTLGHGLKGEVIEHEYWGSEKVVNQLKEMNGFENGLVEISKMLLKRDAQTNNAIGIVIY